MESKTKFTRETTGLNFSIELATGQSVLDSSMGQTESGELPQGEIPVPPVVPAWLQAKLHKQAGQLRQIVTLTYTQFLDSIKELNETVQALCDISGKQLQFQVKRGTDTTILWKGTIRIRCHKVNCGTGAIESTRLLNLKQYIHLYNEITRQASLATVQHGVGAQGLCASIILTELDNHTGVETEPETEECCICMDRKSQVILTCSHTYCEQCIDEWNVNHKTCPICRAAVDNRDDTWVLTEKPDQTEIAEETTGYLLGLADRTGTPSHSPTE